MAFNTVSKTIYKLALGAKMTKGTNGPPPPQDRLHRDGTNKCATLSIIFSELTGIAH
jgi:hypothetical protein